MKKVTFFMIFTLSVGLVKAQDDKFTQAMLSNMEKAKPAQTIPDFQEAANCFERIATSEKTQWTAWYYAAWYNLIINFQETDVSRKKQYLSQAKKLIEEGLKVKPDESEFLVIKVMAYYGEMAIDPASSMDLFPKTAELLEKAKSLNSNNPRIYLTKAEATFNMPVEFGGGKDSARPMLLTAKEKFDKFVPVNKLSPNWGKERCELLLSECQKAKE